MHLILAHLTSEHDGSVIWTFGPLDPSEYDHWFSTLSPDLQQRTIIEYIPVHAVNISPYLDENWGGWLVTSYDDQDKPIMTRRFNDKQTAEDHAASIAN